MQPVPRIAPAACHTPADDVTADDAEAALLPLLARLAAAAKPMEATYRRGGWLARLVVQPATEGDRLNDVERDILEALDGKTMTADEISKAAGYPNDRGLRACLASLRRRGLLTGQPGETGYADAREPLPSPQGD